MAAREDRRLTACANSFIRNMIQQTESNVIYPQAVCLWRKGVGPLDCGSELVTK